MGHPGFRAAERAGVLANEARRDRVDGGYVDPTMMQPSAGYLRAVRLVRDKVRDFKVYPFSIPSIQSLDELALDAKVTFLIAPTCAGRTRCLAASPWDSRLRS